MATTVRLKLDRKAMGDVALRSNEVRALIETRTNAGANSAEAATGEPTFPEMNLKARWYGTYGASARAEADTAGVSSSVAATRNG